MRVPRSGSGIAFPQALIAPDDAIRWTRGSSIEKPLGERTCSIRLMKNPLAYLGDA
jgi:hypothetical protein